MKKISLTLLYILFVIGMASAQSKAVDFGYGTNDAPVVTIGTQIWAAKNLKITTFANGEKIEQVLNNEDWIKAGTEGRPAWCYYQNSEANGPTYGILYNFYAATDPRGLAPKGWHVPSKDEWKTMIATLAAESPGNQLKSKMLWQPVSNIDRNGNNNTGLTIVPAGLRFAANGEFDALGTACHLWTSTQNESVNGAAITLGIAGAITVGIANKKFGYSVRCIKD